MRIKEIAAVRPSWGSPRIHVLLRREGWLVNHKRTERLYRLEGLNLRRNRPRRRKAVVTRGPSVAATRKDERWSMDFMHDQLQDGRRLRVLTVVDQYTREALATEARGSFSAHDVIDVLNRLSRSHRKPAVIQVDNGTEFASRALDAWAYREDVRLDFSRPGKPTDNAHIESFNARLRAECLNAHVFESLEDAEETLTSWRSDYNAVRPHSALGMLTPENSLNSVRGMQAVDGPNSSQLEWHQIGVKTRAVRDSHSAGTEFRGQGKSDAPSQSCALTSPRTRGTRDRVRVLCADSCTSGSCCHARETSQIPSARPATRRSPRA